MNPAGTNPAARAPVSPTAATVDVARPVLAETQGISHPGDASGGAERDDLPAIRGFEIEREVGRGGMGVVYLARQLGFERRVALKVIPRSRGKNAEEVARFKAEGEAFASLDHPNIVSVYEVGEDQGLHYFSMKYLPGGALSQSIHRYRGQPRRIAELMVAVASGMSHAHRRGFLHRDLKPANILLDEDGTPLITDFGLAKRWDGEAHDLTRSGQIIGTPGYMAPEQAAGRHRDMTTATDVYSLGAILYELLTGRPPFQGDSLMEVLMRVIEEPPVKPSKLDEDADGILEAIAMKCLEKDPADRYTTACGMKADLEAYLRGDDVSVIDNSTARFLRHFLRDSRHVEVMALWSRVWMAQAWLTTLFCLSVAVALWKGWTYGQCGTIVLPYLMGLFYATYRFRLRRDVPFSPVEHQLFNIGMSFFICTFLSLFLGITEQIPFKQWLPFVVLMAGMCFHSMALALGGSFYPMTFFCYLVAPLFPWSPPAATALFGILGGIGLYIPARRFKPCCAKAEAMHREAAANPADTVALHSVPEPGT